MIEAIYSSGPNCTAFCSANYTASCAASTTGYTYEELNAVNLDSCTHLPNEKQQATFRCLPQETRNKVTCNIEEKRIEVLGDGRKDEQPQLPLSPSNNVLNPVINKNLIGGTNSRGNKIKQMQWSNSPHWQEIAD